MYGPSAYLSDRIGLLSGGNIAWHPELRAVERKAAMEFVLRADSLKTGWSLTDRKDMQYLRNDNSEWATDSVRQNKRALLRYFYRTPANLFELNHPDFYLRLNPILNFNLGKEANNTLFTNQRGLELRGAIDNRVYFYTNVVESQVKVPAYIQDRTEQNLALPGAGAYKDYNSDFFKVKNGYDFNVANACIGFHATRHVGLQLGHGQHFIGNGYRSLLLSDAGAYYFFLKISTRIWRLHYQNLFLELSPVSQRAAASNGLLPKKYAAIHYLSYNISPRLAVGFFEATVFNRTNHFEFQYLNPVILYRSVESFINSPDNVLVGMDARWDIARRIRLYGQLLLDEFHLSDVYKPEQKGWWGNKFGVQAGLWYLNVAGVDHLDLRLEYNAVRPYTYAHFDSLSAYTHNNQPLAHPLWANFREIAAIARYQPWQRLAIQARYIHCKLGENSAMENWGADPLIPYGSRVQDYGNTTGQGISATLDIVGLESSWQLYHNLFIDLNVMYRHKNSAEDARDAESLIFNGGIRLNFWPANRDF